jgi:RHS repeat-associated protein
VNSLSFHLVQKTPVRSLTQVTHAPNTTGTITYTYGTSTTQFTVGRLVTMTDPSGSESYTYDNMGRMTSLTKVIGGTNYKTSVQYNAAGDLTQLTYPSGRVVQYSYDAAGHLCVVAISASSCSSYANPYLTIASSAYDASSHPLQATLGNGVVGTSTFFPARGQLSSVNYMKGSTFLFGATYRYQNDPTFCPKGTVGNDGQIECIAHPELGLSVNYTYDALGRMSTANTIGDSQYPAWGLSETYDQYGNRTAQTVTAGSGPPSSIGINPANNQIIGYGYDASGHVTSEPASMSSTYSYDGEDCLTNYTGSWIGSSAVYTCDGNHMRVKKVVTGNYAVTRVYIYLGSRLIAEYDNGTAVNVPAREYIYGNALLAVAVGGTTAIDYYIHDHQSVRMLTDSSGNGLYLRGHYPFGELWYGPLQVYGFSTDFTYTSYLRDDESTLDYAQARHYASGTGRFMSADPVHGNPANPLSWNRYVYTLNDPVNDADPSGMDDDTDWGMSLYDNCPDCVVLADGSYINVAADAVFEGVSTPPDQGQCAPYCGFQADVLQTNASGQATVVLIYTMLTVPPPSAPMPPASQSEDNILSMMADPSKCADCGQIFNGTVQFTNIATAATVGAWGLGFAAPAIVSAGAGLSEAGSGIYEGAIQLAARPMGWSYAIRGWMAGQSGYVLGRVPGYLEAAKIEGRGALNAADWVVDFFEKADGWDTLNRAYINAQIFMNQQVYLSDVPVGQDGSGFSMEIQHLISRGVGPEQWKFVADRYLY